MADKNSFILYNSQHEPLKKLSYEQKGMLFDMIFEYNDSGNILEFDDAAVDMAFSFIKISLDENNARYEEQCKQNALNAKKRWNTNNASACDRKRPDAKHADYDYDSDNDLKPPINPPEGDSPEDNTVEEPKDESSGDEVKFTEDSAPYKLAQLLYDRILRNDQKAKKPDLQKWADHIDKLIRLDERTPKEIQDVIIFAQFDDFWKANILSTRKLREKFSALIIKMQKSGSRSSGNDANAGIYHRDYTPDEYQDMITSFEDEPEADDTG